MKTVDIDAIYSILKKHVKNYKTPVVDFINIQTRDPFKVLVSTILSARTNDSTTGAVCERLFKKVTSLDDLGKMSQKELAKLIFPVGFYNTKAKHLKELPHIIKNSFHNKIPESIDALIKLPGVGRKTANLVVSVAFNKPGICVDTHVHKIFNRLGYIKTKTPLETEMTLRKKLPQKYWIPINSMLVSFGQYLCRPISPHCSICPIEEYCNKVGVNNSR